MPFTDKPRSPAVDQAVAEVVALHEQIVRDPKVGRRAVAIRRALDQGATLREIGRALSVSPETVRRYRDQA